MPDVMLNHRPSMFDCLYTNPFIATAYSYNQDDGFGNLIDTVSVCMDDGNSAYYLYAFLERDHLMIYNPIFYSSH